MFNEVIRYYLDTECVLCSCLLDVYKTFDIVYCGILFELLLKKTCSRFIIRLIFDSYLRQEICIMWDGIKSEYVCSLNGVK